MMVALFSGNGDITNIDVRVHVHLAKQIGALKKAKRFLLIAGCYTININQFYVNMNASEIRKWGIDKLPDNASLRHSMFTLLIG